MIPTASQVEPPGHQYSVSNLGMLDDNLLNLTEFLDQGSMSMVSCRTTQMDDKYAKRMQLLDTRKKLQRVLQEVTGQAADLRKQLLSINGSINPVKEAIEILATDIKDSKMLIMNCEARTKTLEDEYATKCKQYDDLISATAELRSTNEAMTEQLQKLQGTVAALESGDGGADEASVAQLDMNDPAVAMRLGIARRCPEPDSDENLQRTVAAVTQEEEELKKALEEKQRDIEKSRQTADRLDGSTAELRGLVAQLSNVLANRSTAMHGPPGSQLYLVFPCRHMILTVGKPLVVHKDRCPKCCVRVADILKVDTQNKSF